LTDKVQTEEIEYRKKTMAFQFCELAEKEEPKMSKNKFKNDEEQNEYFQKLGSERVIKMIEKANEKNPEGTTLTKEHWELLPTTLKYTIANKVIGLESNQAENFISG
jgi:sulfur relay (sulfurtransferase) DsrC/TusE family protein